MCYCMCAPISCRFVQSNEDFLKLRLRELMTRLSSSWPSRTYAIIGKINGPLDFSVTSTFFFVLSNWVISQVHIPFRYMEKRNSKFGEYLCGVDFHSSALHHTEQNTISPSSPLVNSFVSLSHEK